MYNYLQGNLKVYSKKLAEKKVLSIFHKSRNKDLEEDLIQQHQVTLCRVPRNVSFSVAVAADALKQVFSNTSSKSVEKSSYKKL